MFLGGASRRGIGVVKAFQFFCLCFVAVLDKGKKTGRLAMKRILEKNGKIKGLKNDIKETIVAKKEFPDDTMQELATRLNISKSCLNHRLRKIVELSKEE